MASNTPKTTTVIIPIDFVTFKKCVRAIVINSIYNIMEQPKMVVFDTTDSLHNEMLSTLYVKYVPANKITVPRSQIILLLLICMRVENNAVPKNNKEIIINKSPISLCVSPCSITSFSNSIPVQSAVLASNSSIAVSFPI